MAFDGDISDYLPEPPKAQAPISAIDILAWPLTRLWHIRTEVMEHKSFFRLPPFAQIGLCFYASLASSFALYGAGVVTDYGAPWWCAAAFVSFVSWIHGIPAAFETRR
jgi:hypothetical protein